MIIGDTIIIADIMISFYRCPPCTQPDANPQLAQFTVAERTDAVIGNSSTSLAAQEPVSPVTALGARGDYQTRGRH